MNYARWQLLVNLRILLAQPDRQLLTRYRFFLTGLGARVSTARDGLQCLAALRAVRPEILLLDPALPWGDGADVLSIMYNDLQLHTTQVLILSGDTGPNLIERAILVPVQSQRFKPLGCEQLADWLAEILSPHHAVAGECEARRRSRSQAEPNIHPQV